MENPLTFRCERMGCHYSSTFRTAEDYERWVSHHLTKDCPLKGNKIRFGRGAIVTVLKELWEHADRTLDAFLKPGTMLTDNEYTKGELGGQCYAIWKISGVYYATLEDVKQALFDIEVRGIAVHPWNLVQTPHECAARASSAFTRRRSALLQPARKSPEFP